jgi:hypothetical protein
MYALRLFDQHPDLLYERFLQTDFGKLYQTIPFKELAALVPAPSGSKSGRGCKAWLKVEGGIALLIAKHYLQLSDAMLVERLNTDWSLQMFCGIQLRPHEVIKDEDLPGRWRRYIGQHLDIEKWQLHLAAFWAPQMEEKHVALVDATCYESYIAYPTDAKLLWKGCTDVWNAINMLRRKAGLRRSRAVMYDKAKKYYLNIARRRKTSRKQNKKLCKSLLKFLDRLLKELHALMDCHGKQHLSNRMIKRLNVIENVKKQQWSIYFGKEATVPNRIVSLHKPYVRPIVRGKETKPVEFGAKVNKLQVNGISFIEHISFEAFHEGNRLQQSIEMHQRYFGKCHQAGADAIYATNANRKFCTTHNIATCFVRKGKEPADEIRGTQQSTMRSLLAKERSTRLEGSFGNEKNHYLLNKIKAGTQSTELVWIFFGILCSNAVLLTKRRCQSQSSKKAA